MGITAFQRIVNKHLLHTLPDGTLVISLDMGVGHEITTPPHINEATKRGYDFVFDPNKVFAMIDHVRPADDSKTARQGKIMREWSKKHGIPFADIGDGGICHAFVPQSALIGPGGTGIIDDSHGCTWGALGAFSMGVGTTDFGCGVVTGFFLLIDKHLKPLSLKRLMPCVHHR